MKSGNLMEVPIQSIKIKKNHNPRHSGQPDAELTASIRTDGVLQPISVRPDGQGGFTIIDGERRFRAAQKAGLKSLMVVDRGDLDDTAAFEEAVILNGNHKGFTPEEQYSISVRLQQGGYSRDRIAQMLNISPNKVREFLRVEKAGTEELKAATKSGKVSPRVGSRIAALPETQQDAVVKKTKGKTQRAGLKAVSDKTPDRRTVLGGRGPAPRKKKLFSHPPEEMPPVVYRLAEDVEERCRTVENEAHRHNLLKGRSAECLAYLDLIAVLKGERDPMSLFG